MIMNDGLVKSHQDGWQSRGTVTLPLLNRHNDEGKAQSASGGQMDFLRSHHEYNEAISYLSRLKCVSLPFFKKYWSPLYLFPVARRISGWC